MEKKIHERFQWCRKSCYEFYFCFRKLNNSATCVVSDCGLSITLSYRYCDVFLSMALKREIGKRKTFSRNGSIGCKASSRTTAIGNEKIPTTKVGIFCDWFAKSGKRANHKVWLCTGMRSCAYVFYCVGAQKLFPRCDVESHLFYLNKRYNIFVSFV